jgi:hypothetical protein
MTPPESVRLKHRATITLPALSIMVNAGMRYRAHFAGNGVEAWRLAVAETARYRMAVVVNSTF